MADSNSLKVLAIFEAGSRLGTSAEISALAAHIYHRFFRIKLDFDNYELYTVAASCIKLAHMAFERPLNCKHLALVMVSIVHGEGFQLADASSRKIESSIDLMARIICINLDYQINYKDTRMMTPGDLIRSTKAKQQLDATLAAAARASGDEFSDTEYKVDELLSNNSKYPISGHRYLAHYLKTIKLLVEPSSAGHFRRVSDIAWTILCDFYWSPCVTTVYANHLACAALMMAIDVSKKNLDQPRRADKAILWKILNRKWNLIFCDHLNKQGLDRIYKMIVDQYREYERVLQHELNTYVIDPMR